MAWLAGTLALTIALGAGLAYTIPHLAHAASASVTDSTCTPASYAADVTTVAVATSGNTGTITFDCATASNIVVNASGGPGTVTIAGSSSLTITSTGAGVALDGNKAVQLFVVAGGGSLSLGHLIIANGSATYPAYGGGVQNNGGTLTITDSTFSDNVAIGDNSGDSGQGGGVYSSGGTVTITSSTFSGNQANDPAGSFGSGPAGGGAYIGGGAVAISASTFSGNQAGASGLTSSYGGGLDIAAGATATITGSTFSKNQASGFGVGGGVANSGTVTISASTFSENQVSGTLSSGIFTIGGEGGGLANETPGPGTPASATITGSTFSDNTSSGGAGGILNLEGTLSLANSTVAGNQANGTGGFIFVAPEGGGLATLLPGMVTVTGTTFSDNSSSTDAGGIADDFGSTLTLANSTLTGNHATSGSGGGVYVTDLATATITNTTITGNTATVSSGGAGGEGGGVDSESATTITNSIVAANAASDTKAPNCFIGSSGTLTDGGYNLEDNSSGTDCGFASANHDQLVATTAALDLGTLGNNGGPTQTIPLLVGSPAIDNALASTCAGPQVGGVDQRGVSRPQGTSCDIGAYEDAPTTSATLTANPTLISFGQSVQLCATAAATVSGVGTPSGTVTFKDGGSGLGSATLNSSGKACLSTSSLAVGTHSVTASYGGGGGFSGSASKAVTVTVGEPGQDVMGGGSGGNPPSQSAGNAATPTSNAQANLAGQQQHAAGTPASAGSAPGQPTAVTGGSGFSFWLPLGVVLLLLGLGGLGFMLYRARRATTPLV